MKKVIKIILVILIIYLIGITVNNIYVMNVWGLDKSNSMSDEEIEELLSKATINENYSYFKEHYELESKSFVMSDIYIKNNIIAIYTSGKPEYWIDLNNNEAMKFWNYYGPIVSIKDISKTMEENSYNEYTFAKLKLQLSTSSYWNKIKYLGEKEINGRPTVVLESNYSDSAKKEIGKLYCYFIKEFYFIDKQTGVLIKEERTSSPRFLRNPLIIQKSLTEYNVKFDSVTDENIARPNLNGYTVNYDDFYILF